MQRVKCFGRIDRVSEMNREKQVCYFNSPLSPFPKKRKRRRMFFHWLQTALYLHFLLSLEIYICFLKLKLFYLRFREESLLIFNYFFLPFVLVLQLSLDNFFFLIYPGLIDYIQNDPSILPRIGIITVAGLGGVVAGYKREFFVGFFSNN